MNKGYTKLDNEVDLKVLLGLPNALVQPYLYLLSRRNLDDPVVHWGLVAGAINRSQRRTHDALKALEERGLIESCEGGWQSVLATKARRKRGGSGDKTAAVLATKPTIEEAENTVPDGDFPPLTKRTKGTKENKGNKKQIHVAEATSVYPAVEPIEPTCETKNDALDTKKRKPSLDYEAFLSIWNDKRGVLPAVLTLNTDRRKKLALFVKECKSFEEACQIFSDAVCEAAQDKFWQERRYGLDHIFGKIHQKAESWQSRRVPENKTPQNDDDDKDDYTMAELFNIARGAQA